MKRILFYARLVTAIAVFGLPLPSAYAGGHNNHHNNGPTATQVISKLESDISRLQDAISKGQAGNQGPATDHVLGNLNRLLDSREQSLADVHERCGC